MALRCSARASRSAAGAVAPAVRAPPSYFSTPSCSSSSFSSSASSSLFSTSVSRRTEHERTESPAREHRRHIERTHHDEITEGPLDNATRDRDAASAEHAETMSNLSAAFEETPDGRHAADLSGSDPLGDDPIVQDAAESSVSQGMLDIENRAAETAHTPPSIQSGQRAFSDLQSRSNLQPGGYGYTISTLPTKSQPILELLINITMESGKKAAAQKRILGAVKLLSEYLNTDPLPAIQEALEMSRPLVGFRKMALGAGKTAQCPVPLKDKAGLRKAAHNLIEVSGRRSEPRFETRLAREILAILEGTSGVLKKKEEVHKEGIRQRGNLNLVPR